MLKVHTLTFIYATKCACPHRRVTYEHKTYRAAPTSRLLDRRSARGSAGSAMRSQSWAMSALMTSRFGSLLKEDLAPRVAASLQIVLSTRSGVSKDGVYYQRRPKPLSRLERSSEVKNMGGGVGVVRQWVARRIISARRQTHRFPFHTRELP